MLIEIRKLTCPAALLVRPEHVLGISKHGAFLDASKVSVDISSQVQTKGNLLLMYSFYLKYIARVCEFFQFW
jgi:hypothetical protein